MTLFQNELKQVMKVGLTYYETNKREPKDNKPDTKIRDNKQGRWMLTEVTIPGDRNVINKEAEKILKYKDLTTEIQRM